MHLLILLLLASFFCFLQKHYKNGHQMTKIPLGISKYFKYSKNLIPYLFIRILQFESLKTDKPNSFYDVFSFAWRTVRPHRPHVRPRTVRPQFLVILTNCATSNELCDQLDQLCGRTLGNFGQKLRNWSTLVPMTLFSIILSMLSVFKQNNNSICTLRLIGIIELVNILNIPILPFWVIFHF